MSTASLIELLEAGVHFGHQTQHWNPKMKPYIYGARNGIYILDLRKTSDLLDAAYEAVREYAAKHGADVVVISARIEAELVDLCIRFKRTDGVIIVNPLSDYTGDRIVSMNISPHSSPDLSDAIKLLKNGGHTRISFIGSTSGSFNSVLFKNILADNGIRSGNNYYAESDVSSELGGYETMEYLFGMPSIPTAVIAETDTMAMGAEKYILKRGLKVPKDISVIGLESSSFSENSILECKSAVTGIFKKMKAYYKR